MSKFIVETFYTCTFKIIHKLDVLNEKKLSELENRNDGQVKIIDVKLNNRKTKTANQNENNEDSLDRLSEKNIPNISSIVNEKIINSEKLQSSSKLDSTNVKTKKSYNKNNDRSKMPDRRKGYISY
jgi:ribonucleoside-diphosphate reductase alpha chain